MRLVPALSGINLMLASTACVFVTEASVVPLPDAFKSLILPDMKPKFVLRSVRLLEKVVSPTKKEVWLVVTAPLSKSSVKTAKEQLKLLKAGPTFEAFTKP